jgi:hypothetical protein
MRLWIWRHFRLELPDDWEMLQFSRESRVGRCSFADRYQFRLELSWRTAQGPPDFDRLMSDYLAKLKLDATMPDAASTRVGDWPGLEGHQGGMLTSRFGRHFAGESCLVEAVFLWPESKDERLEEGILKSVAAEPEHPGRLRRWKAFGMDLLATSGLEMEECRVDPAYARMSFASAQPGREETFERLGMVSEWLRVTVKEWLHQQTPRDVALSSKGSAAERGHAIETIGGSLRAGLVRKPRRHEAAAWICPEDGRLYHVSTTGAEAGEAAPLAGRRLSCCREMEQSRNP